MPVNPTQAYVNTREGLCVFVLDVRIVLPFFLPTSIWNGEEMIKMPIFFLHCFMSGSAHNPEGGERDLVTSAV